VIETLVVLTVVVLGVAAGALLAEAVILVPFWQSIEATAFLAWYKLNAARLLRFFGPLEVGALLVPGLATTAAWFHEAPELVFLGAATALSFLVLISFPLYFRDANANFEQGTIDPDDVPRELRRWGRWHWVRTIAATLAFCASVLAVRGVPWQGSP
jgi:hypothetical protein